VNPIAGQSAPPGAGFDVETTRSLGRASRTGRVVFALAFGLVGLFVLPPGICAGWIGAVLLWETVNPRILDGFVVRLPHQRAITAYAVCNFIGACVFHSLAFLALAQGSVTGAALGVAWLSGAFTNNFVYFAGNRRLLWSSLTPGIAAAVVGPAMSGIGPSAAVQTVLILLGLVAARAYALDHRAVLGQLADRQVELADVERKLSVAIEASGDGLFELRFPSGVQGDANWQALMGYGPGELAMPIQDWRERIHPDDIEEVEREYARHLAGETSHSTSEMRMLCKDGSYKWVLSRGRLVERTPAGAPLRIIGTSIDISARKALEDELKAARDAAERANQAKSVFVANMSHEIRTPLNGVVGLAGALARSRLTADQQEMVKLIQSSGEVLDRLLTDILDQAKIEAGDFTLRIAPFDLRAEFDAAVELMRARAEDKGLTFGVTYSEAAAGRFRGDAVRLRQIVSNLAANAVKFTEAGGVQVSIDVEPGPDGLAWLQIAVADTGIGIEAAAAEQLFQRFHQADDSISRRFGGTGLGLSISRSLAELMGGDIGVESEPGKGSLFKVRAPLECVEEGAQGDGAASTDPLIEPLEGLRVLLAEDHPVNQKVVQLILEPLGVQLHAVANGLAAVEAFDGGGFDVVLMDMQMPVMDGLSAVRRIRLHEKGRGAPRTPVVMLTANASDEHRRMGAEAGADHHLTKPITPESLVAAMTAVLPSASGAARPVTHQARA